MSHVNTIAVVDARSLLQRLYDLESQARQQTFTDNDWQTHPIAREYRALLCQWWRMPSRQCMAALYEPIDAAAQAFRSRLLTSKATLADRKRGNDGPFVRFTSKEKIVRDVTRRLTQ